MTSTPKSKVVGLLRPADLLRINASMRHAPQLSEDDKNESVGRHLIRRERDRRERCCSVSATAGAVDDVLAIAVRLRRLKRSTERQIEGVEDVCRVYIDLHRSTFERERDTHTHVHLRKLFRSTPLGRFVKNWLSFGGQPRAPPPRPVSDTGERLDGATN